MIEEVDPKSTTRAYAFEMWMKAPMPMVTFYKTIDVSRVVSMYSGVFNNPFMIWGRYRRHWMRTTLKVSFQFHHTQMDGAHAARFLHLLQQEIRSLGS